MPILTYRFAGFIVLSLLLLLGVGADPALMNSDENDDDTMVVAVETDLAAPCKTITDACHLQSRLDTTLVDPGKRKVFAKEKNEHTPDLASCPLIVPLRT
jgi:hypothetical protein